MNIKTEEDRNNVEFWQSINPQARISDNPYADADLTPYHVAADFKSLRNRLSVEGYFHTDPIVDQEDIERLKRIIVNVVKKTPYRSTYALLYDDFYQVAAKLRNLLGPILGERYLLVADEIEAYYIENSDSAGGSPHHRDSLNTYKSIARDGTPLLLNAWIALTDVSPEDACMYVVPAQHDPDYPTHGIKPETPNRIRFHPEDIRAVPVKAGSVICWSTSLIHWGGRNSSFSKHPRMSFAMYFQSGDVAPFHYACFEIGEQMHFPLRMHLVEKAYQFDTDMQASAEKAFKRLYSQHNSPDTGIK